MWNVANQISKQAAGLNPLNTPYDPINGRNPREEANKTPYTLSLQND